MRACAFALANVMLTVLSHYVTTKIHVSKNYSILLSTISVVIVTILQVIPVGR